MTEILYHTFQCPRCGSRKWGTEGLNKPFRQWTGYCQGIGCSFSWCRFDDAKYWVPINDVDWDEEEGEC